MRQPFQLYPTSSNRPVNLESDEVFNYEQKMRQIIFLAIVLAIVTVESYLLVSCYQDNKFLNETIAEKERIIGEMPSTEQIAERIRQELIKRETTNTDAVISESPPIKTKTRTRRPATKRESFADGYGLRRN